MHEIFCTTKHNTICKWWNYHLLSRNFWTVCNLKTSMHGKVRSMFCLRELPMISPNWTFNNNFRLFEKKTSTSGIACRFNKLAKHMKCWHLNMGMMLVFCPFLPFICEVLKQNIITFHIPIWYVIKKEHHWHTLVYSWRATKHIVFLDLSHSKGESWVTNETSIGHKVRNKIFSTHARHSIETPIPELAILPNPAPLLENNCDKQTMIRS